MKKHIYIILISFIITSSINAQIVSEDFEQTCNNYNQPFFNGCIQDWISVSGNPSTLHQEDLQSLLNGAPDSYQDEGVRYVQMYADYKKNSPCGDQSFSETIALEFDFQPEVTYNINYNLRWQRLTASCDNLDIQWVLTKDRANVTAQATCNSTNTISLTPDLYDNDIIIKHYDNVSTIYEWQNETVTFTPPTGSNFNQLWLRVKSTPKSSGCYHINNFRNYVYLDNFELEEACVNPILTVVTPLANQYCQNDNAGILIDPVIDSGNSPIIVSIDESDDQGNIISGGFSDYTIRYNYDPFELQEAFSLECDRFYTIRMNPLDDCGTWSDNQIFSHTFFYNCAPEAPIFTYTQSDIFCLSSEEKYIEFCFDGPSISSTNYSWIFKTIDNTEWNWEFINGTNENSENPCIKVDMSTFDGSGIFVELYTQQLCGDEKYSTQITAQVDCGCFIPTEEVPLNIEQVQNQVTVSHLLDLSTTQQATVIWNFGDGTVVNSLDPVTHVYSELGDYYIYLNVIGIGPDGSCCSAQYVQFVKVTSISQNECKILDANFIYDITGNEVTFNSNINTDIGTIIKDVLWFTSDNGLVTGENATYTYPQGDNSTHLVCMNVFAENAYGQECNTSICKYISLDTKKDQTIYALQKREQQLHPSDHTFNIFPNPSSGQWILQSTNLKNAKNINIKVIDISGRVVFQKTLRDKTNGSYTINNNNLKTGVYIINISTTSGINENHKLVIQN